MKNFPQYLKYKGRQTWIKILSENEWHELRVLGKFYTISQYKAHTFTDRNQLTDLIENKDGFLEEISEDEFSIVVEDCKNSKTVNDSL